MVWMRWIAGCVVAVPLTGWAAGPCAATPQAAVRAFASGAPVEDGSEDGYKVVGVRSDPVLAVNWADVRRCGHPEWPGVSVATTAAGGFVAARAAAVVVRGPLLVRAGEVVQVWRNEANVRFEVSAVSDGGGVVDRIRLHIVTHEEDGGDSVRYVFGLVRGAGNVEMEQ
jgi:hypothetical protein